MNPWPPTLAYIDPGTGSLVLQILIAGFVGAMYALKLFWRDVAASLRRRFHGKDGSKGNDDTP